MEPDDVTRRALAEMLRRHGPQSGEWSLSDDAVAALPAMTVEHAGNRWTFRWTSTRPEAARRERHAYSKSQQLGKGGT